MTDSSLKDRASERDTGNALHGNSETARNFQSKQLLRKRRSDLKSTTQCTD
jgi:hypothetical protein